MKYIIALITIATVILIACNSENNNRLFWKPGNLIPDEYVINIEKDTTLVTKNGALLKIPKGTLKTNKGSSVTLEIKEAYSLEQMMRAGLTTQSNGEPLSSGGMIYINAKGGQDVIITQAIKVAIPTDYLSPEMKLYKGETNADGGVSWVAPTTLTENKQLAVIDRGKQLFESKCASCHSIGKDLTGPNLAHFMKRFPVEDERLQRYYEHGFYPNTDRLVSDEAKSDTTDHINAHFGEAFYHPDPYYTYKCNLRNFFGSVRGPKLFTDTTNPQADILPIYKYIQNESDKRKLAIPPHAYLFNCADSCTKYQQRVIELKEQKQIAEQKRADQVKGNGPLTEEKRNSGPPVSPDNFVDPPAPVNFDDVISPENNKSVYYQFSIETFGWYNVDVVLKDVNGNKESELTVRIMGSYRERVEIFLIIPEQKIYAKAGKKKGGADEYVFAYTNGKIFLPQNAKAYILAMSEAESTIVFDLNEFTTGLSQQIQMELKTSTKEAFNEAVSRLDGNEMKVSVNDAKNADNIRKTETDLKTIDAELKKAENLKPKNCDCDCQLQSHK